MSGNALKQDKIFFVVLPKKDGVYYHKKKVWYLAKSQAFFWYYKYKDPKTLMIHFTYLGLLPQLVSDLGLSPLPELSLDRLLFFCSKKCDTN